ncbi:MAG: hypothetical protein U0521_18120 [Anaerolineae bacterium]
MTAVSILFDFASDVTLLDKEHMVRLLIAVADGDMYQFLKKAIVCDDSPGLNYVPNSPETLANAWNNAIRARQRYNGYWMEFENAAGLRFSFGFDPDGARRLFLSAKKTDLRADDNLRAFVRVGEIIFNTLRPLYGVGLFSYDSHETPEVDVMPAALWDVNYFGAGLVYEWGRETLDAIPAWSKTELAGGGLLVELSENPIMRPQIQNYREASAALGSRGIFRAGEKYLLTSNPLHNVEREGILRMLERS